MEPSRKIKTFFKYKKGEGSVGKSEHPKDDAMMGLKAWGQGGHHLHPASCTPASGILSEANPQILHPPKNRHVYIIDLKIL